MFNQRMFYTMALLVAVLVFAVGCSAVAAPVALTGSKSGITQPLAYQASSGSVERGITVVGVGKASGTPDVANVSVGIETRDQSVQKAVADNNARMSELLDVLKGLGIPDKDIRTSNYSVYAESQPIFGAEGKGEEGPLIYHVSNQVTLTLRDISKLGDVLDKAVATGANNIYGVGFTVDDTSKLEAEARADAIADAKSRAESLAKLVGVSLGDVLNVSEVVSGTGPVYERMAVPAGGAPAPIQPGELEVTMNVQVTYAIK